MGKKGAITELRRELGLLDATMVVVGATIGAGIFFTSGAVAKQLADPWALIAVWIFGGLLSLAGALTLAELGAAMPQAGGDYIYLKETYGPLWGFLTGWTSFLVTFSGSIAALAVGFAESLGAFFPALALKSAALRIPITHDHSLTFSYAHGVAVLSVLILTLVNYRGVQLGSRVQDVLSLLKIGLLLGLVTFGLGGGRGDWSHFHSEIERPFSPRILSAFGLALIPALFAYNGWNAAIYIGSEIKQPQRNVTRALIFGTLLCAVVYVLVNLVYVYALPVRKMAGVDAIGDLAARALFGPLAADLVGLAILVALLSCMNAMILTGARIYYAMARDHLFFRSAGHIHPRCGTPDRALWLQAACCCVLVITGTFQQLITYVVFAIVLFSAITGAAVFVLRRQRPHMERPYKTWGYPFVPALFVLSNLGLAINMLVKNRQVSLTGLLIVAAGIPAYLYWKSRIQNPKFRIQNPESRIQKPENK